MEFGDELIIESYRIPALIWIQLLVMVLLFIVLFFGVSVLNLNTSSSSEETAVSPLASRHAALPIHLTDSTSSHNIVKEEDGSSTSANDESSLKNSMFMRFFRHPNHLCNYIRLVKRAILKCFGVDSSSENSTNSRHQKQD